MAGANPTFADCWVQAGHAIELTDETDLWANANSPNWLGLEDDAQSDLDGEYIPDALALIKGERAGAFNMLQPATLQRVWEPYLLEMGRAVGLQENSQGGVELLRAIRKYMHDNSQSINSRGMTLNNPADSGSPTGNGTIRRCTVDKDGYALECTGAEAKTAECETDHTSGASKHAERFRFEGATLDPSFTQWTGSGLDQLVTAAHAKSTSIVTNPSFESHAATSDDTAPSSTTSVTGWTITTSASNFKHRSAAGYTYRGYPGEPSTLWGLEFTGNDTISQIISQNSRRAFDRRVPYYCSIAVQRKASATGTVTINLGSQSANVSLASLTNDVWSILLIPMGTACYYDNFNETDLDVSIAVTSLATGTVVIDDLVLAPMVNVDGTFYLPVGGSTAWLVNDKLAWTDTDGGTRAKFSYWLWRAFGSDGWLPSDNSGTETISDP